MVCNRNSLLQIQKQIHILRFIGVSTALYYLHVDIFWSVYLGRRNVIRFQKQVSYFLLSSTTAYKLRELKLKSLHVRIWLIRKGLCSMQ